MPSERTRGPRPAGAALAAALALCVAAAQAQAASPRTASPQAAPAPAPACAVEAYIMPPAEPLVRARPTRDAAVVGRLRMTRYEDEDEAEGADVTVVAIRDGWARIAQAPAKNDVAAPIPGGWIDARHLAMTLQTEVGFAAPDPRSRAVHRDEHGVDRGMIQRFLGCSGEWLRLEIRDRDGARRRGWFRGACANQRTTCDGVHGDGPSRDGP